MPDSTVFYLMSGPAHLPYLAVSLRSLRQVWDGPVKVFAYPESYDLAKLIADDPRIKANAELWRPPYTGKNGQFINKIMVARQLPDGRNLYLDADTIVSKPIDGLFEMSDCGFVATQFNRWEMRQRLVSKRILTLRGAKLIDPQLIERAAVSAAPSVNGGVFVSRPGSEVLKTWLDWSLSVKKLFICDEIVLHVICEHYQNSGRLSVAAGGQWNCSPRFRPAELTAGDVAIWHGHGDTFTRPSKSHLGVETWLPLFQECLIENIGGMCGWWEACGNKWLNSSTFAMPGKKNG